MYMYMCTAVVYHRKISPLCICCCCCCCCFPHNVSSTVRLACPIEELVEAADVVSFTVEVDSLGFNVLVFDSIPVAKALVNVVNR
jgi:hypothetical protein